MSNSNQKYIKEFAYLVCVDSDGCVMDTMESKHRRCFGPKWIEVFHLEPWGTQCMELWLHINLYSMTRGINRFRGLSLALTRMKEINQEIPIPVGLEAFVEWTQHSPELSNQSLAAFLKETKCPCAEKAIAWSFAVNEAVEQLLQSHEQRPFAHVSEALESISLNADIAGVSSANREAVEKEWKSFHLWEHCKTVLCQDAGSKAFCIGRLLEEGYLKTNCLMAGDAPGDYKAAVENGIWFYPIIPKHESESWRLLSEDAFPKLLEGTFDHAYQNQLMEKFYDALNRQEVCLW